MTTIETERSTMNRKQRPKASDSTPESKPYCIVGAGNLTSHIWKRAHGDEQFIYRFNLFRTQRNGRATQLLRPEDVLPLAKFVRVISQVLAEDGCISPDQRRQLSYLATALDEILDCPEVKQSHNSRAFDSLPGENV